MIKQETLERKTFYKVGDFVLEYLVIIMILALVIVTAIVEPRFLTAANFRNVMGQFGPLSFTALGMTFIIMGGFIDLSLPGMISLIAMITLSLFDIIGEIPAMMVGMMLGIALGSLNGTILVKFGATTQAKALFITFGLSQLYGALSQLYTGGSPINRGAFEHPAPLTQALSSGTVGDLFPFYSFFNYIPFTFIVFLVFLAILFIFQKKTRLGRSINYTGGNFVAAELGGIPTKRITVMIYAICGLMVAIGAIVAFSRANVAAPVVIGANFERDSIMAVVVGGTSLAGGRGSVLRTVLGVSLIILLSNCMNLMRIDSHLQETFRGAVLVVAIWLDHRRHAKG
ncbi:MAG: ABC transporter permease [Oscillospiraceae bacterium]|nr:ABC transporter permease [Oscillospiraceae bacterium]